MLISIFCSCINHEIKFKNACKAIFFIDWKHFKALIIFYSFKHVTIMKKMLCGILCPQKESNVARMKCSVGFGCNLFDTWMWKSAQSTKPCDADSMIVHISICIFSTCQKYWSIFPWFISLHICIVFQINL